MNIIKEYAVFERKCNLLYILYQTPQASHHTAHSTLNKRPLGLGRCQHICVQSTFCERWIYNSGFKQGGCFGRYSASGRLEFWHNFRAVLLPSDVFCLFWERTSKSGQSGWQTVSSLSTNTPNLIFSIMVIVLRRMNLLHLALNSISGIHSKSHEANLARAWRAWRQVGIILVRWASVTPPTLPPFICVLLSSL